MEGATNKLKTNQVKRVTKRASFMSERCQSEGCYREFKVEKDYAEYKLTCPYCGKRVESTRILKQKMGEMNK